MSGVPEQNQAFPPRGSDVAELGSAPAACGDRCHTVTIPARPSTATSHQLELGCQGHTGNLTDTLGWGSPALWGHSPFFHVASNIPVIKSPDNFLLHLLPGSCLC